MDKYIEDISYGGYGTEGAPISSVVYVYHNMYQWVPTNLSYHEDAEVDALLRSWARRLGAELNNAMPISGFKLEDGSRVQAAITRSVSPLGSSYTIRRFREEPLTFIDMVRNDITNESIYAMLWFALENKSNIAVVGGTAAGKTTFLGSLLLFLPEKMKVVTLEDTRELNLDRWNWSAMVTKSPSMGAEGGLLGGVTMQDLLMASLRQRPDYLVVGEVRGEETRDMVQAMATGQKTLTTFHADSWDTFYSRLTNKPIEVGEDLISSIHMVVFIKRDERGKRRVVNIMEPYLTAERKLLYSSAMTIENDKPKIQWNSNSPTVKRISQDIGRSTDYVLDEVGRRTEFLKRLTDKNWREEVWNYA
jgi:flagellar protein FlaI